MASEDEDGTLVEAEEKNASAAGILCEGALRGWTGPEGKKSGE